MTHEMTDADWLARLADRDRDIDGLQAENARLHREINDAHGYIGELEAEIRATR